jgi:hypothetical protein
VTQVDGASVSVIDTDDEQGEGAVALEGVGGLVHHGR